MSQNQSLSQRWFIKGLAFVIISLLLLARIVYGQTQAIENKEAILQGSITLHPVKILAGDLTNKIQPGTAVKVVAIVENIGQQANPAGQIYVRYAFDYPLENEAKSNIFETEKKNLPSIEPGKQIELSFDATHQFPSLLDFVRNDWSLREYQVIALINEKENMIGTLAMTLSAYYYPGVKIEIPKPISQ